MYQIRIRNHSIYIYVFLIKNIMLDTKDFIIVNWLHSYHKLLY